MELISSLLSALGVSASFLSIVWIYRMKKRGDSVFSLFAILLFAFSNWQFLWHSDPLDGIVVNSLILIAVYMNLFYMHCLRFTLRVNRRDYRTRFNNTVANRHTGTHS